jgi:hypothetical protein
VSLKTTLLTPNGCPQCNERECSDILNGMSALDVKWLLNRSVRRNKRGEGLLVVDSSFFIVGNNYDLSR